MTDCVPAHYDPDESLELLDRTPTISDYIPLRPSDHREHFARYLAEFVDPFSVKSYHTKTSYRSGFFVPKRKSGHPIPLINHINWKKVLLNEENAEWLHKTESVEQHLDFDLFSQFKAWHHSHPRWLGLLMPNSYDKHLLDIDNQEMIDGKWKKHTLLVYQDCDDPKHISKWRIMGNGEEHVVTHMPLEHFKRLKKIYDTFPGRIWCISSQTLGIHAWKKHQKMFCADTFRDISKQLKEIGQGHTEVHPNPHRCIRLPFGKDYITITQNGTLRHWTSQVDFFIKDGQTPSFDQIVHALLHELEEQWERFFSFSKDLATKILRPYRHEPDEVQEWLCKGCPNSSISSSFSLSSDYLLSDGGLNPKPTRTPTSSNEHEIIDLRHGNYAKALQKLAHIGLVPLDRLVLATATDSSPVPLLCYEFAKYGFHFLFWERPEQDRIKFLTDWLIAWVFQKHNGVCSRLLSNDLEDHEDVRQQISRVVERAAYHMEDDKRIFAIMREKKLKGRYKHIINPFIPLNGVTSFSSSLSSDYLLSDGGLVIDQTPLPEALLQRIKAVNGRCRVEKFATCFLNHLKAHGGVANVSQEIFWKMLGYRDTDRLRAYKKILKQAGLVMFDPDQATGYVPHRLSKRYALTNVALTIFGLKQYDDHQPTFRRYDDREVAAALADTP